MSIPGFRDASVDRRDFLKTALAIGGSAALSACIDLQADPIPTGVDNPDALPERQHAWNEFLPTDDHGMTRLPKYHTILFLTYRGDGIPASAERNIVESALQSIEQAYEFSAAGAVFTLGYSPSYFDRYESSLPESVDLPMPRSLSPMEDPTLNTQDAVLHVASDRPDALLGIEEAMFGDRPQMNSMTVNARLGDVFTVSERRTGFVGPGLPAKKQDGVEGVPNSNPVPEGAPVFMGFRAGFPNGQATEDYVTLSDGPFAGGTTQHISQLRLRLKDWWGEQDHDERVAELFSPVHAENNWAGDVGEKLGTNSKVTEEIAENTMEHAKQYGRVGHAQKNARGREDGMPPLLRRDFDGIESEEAVTHFIALQEEISKFEKIRQLMNGQDVADSSATVRQRVNNGILEYVFVMSRGNFLVPPRSLRSLPRPHSS